MMVLIVAVAVGLVLSVAARSIPDRLIRLARGQGAPAALGLRHEEGARALGWVPLLRRDGRLLLGQGGEQHAELERL